MLKGETQGETLIFDERKNLKRPNLLKRMMSGLARVFNVCSGSGSKYLYFVALSAFKRFPIEQIF